MRHTVIVPCDVVVAANIVWVVFVVVVVVVVVVVIDAKKTSLSCNRKLATRWHFVTFLIITRFGISDSNDNKNPRKR